MKLEPNEYLQQFTSLRKTEKVFNELENKDLRYKIIKTAYDDRHSKNKTHKKMKWHNVASRIYSLYIRCLKSDDKLIWTCISCGKKLFWRGEWLQAGHFRKAGSSLKHKFNDDNVRPQCNWCNIMLDGNYQQYTIAMVDKFWIERVKDILADKWIVKIRDYDYKDMIEKRRRCINLKVKL